MDLPERVLLNKTNSRLGLTRQNFKPYTFDQLVEIVSSRLFSLDVFGSESIELAARKVASVSGDARRALDICRYALSVDLDELLTYWKLKKILAKISKSRQISYQGPSRN